VCFLEGYETKTRKDNTMITATIALTEYLHKYGLEGNKGFLEESVRIMSQMLMELEVE
jgi:hypothetical protein